MRLLREDLMMDTQRLPFLPPWNGNDMAIPTFPEDIIAAEGSAYPPHFPVQAPPLSSQDLTMDTQMLPFRPPWNENSMAVPIFSEDTVAAEGIAYPPYLQDQGPPFPQNPTPAAIIPFQVPKIPSKFDWENHRAEITRLYRDEKRTLNEVMKFMRERYDFRATTKMYKTRISDWDIRRNLRRSEREDACRELQQRWHSGEKVSTVFVRGQEKNVAVLLRHIRNVKRPVHDRSTPSRNQTWHMHNGIVSPASPLYPAGDERPVEVICMQVAYVFESSSDLFESGDGLYGHVSRATEKARDSQYHDARVSLNRAGQWIKDQIRYKASDVLLYILRSLSLRHLDPTQHFKPVDLLHVHALSLSKIVHGPCHPLTVVLTQLLSIQDWAMASSSALQAAIQAIQGSSGGFLVHIYLLRDIFADILEDSGDHQRVGQLRLEALEELRRLTPQYTRAMINAAVSLAWHYLEFEPDKEEEAAKLFESIQDLGSGPDTENADYAACLSYHGLGCIAKDNGNLGKGEHCFRAAADAAVKCWGEGDMGQVGVLGDLAEVLDLQGKHGEAERVWKQCQLVDDVNTIEDLDMTM